MNAQTTTIKMFGKSINVLARNDGSVKVFSNRTQAEAAAAKCGGESFQSIQSARFLVRVDG